LAQDGDAHGSRSKKLIPLGVLLGTFYVERAVGCFSNYISDIKINMAISKHVSKANFYKFLETP
jgi:hypothetical protein